MAWNWVRVRTSVGASGKVKGKACDRVELAVVVVGYGEFLELEPGLRLGILGELVPLEMRKLFKWDHSRSQV